MILYINNEHCTSLEQLKGYFKDDLTPGSNVYADLLDYGRYGDIAVWLREMDEQELASRVESIPDNLSDSAFFARLKAAITDSEVTDGGLLKPSFESCFAFEGIKCNVKDNEAKVGVNLKVLMCVNEEYELSVSGNWGTRAVRVNPYSYEEGKTAGFDFTFHKRPGKDIGEIKVLADGKEMAGKKVPSYNDDEEIQVGNVRFKMIRVEGGTFTMGATSEMKDAFEDEKPTHQVTLSDYSIGETQVTQALWEAVMGSNPSRFKGDDLPVEEVSWDDCQNFIKILNAETGRKFRLPTEAEWEFAARGGIKSNHTQYSGSDKSKDVAWYNANSYGQTHPVKTKKPNELGIYDMSGNVWEWCSDWYGDYEGGSQTDPTGPASGSYRVGRGGCWGYDARICRSSFRNSYSPGDADSGLGFRLVLSE